MLNILVYTGAQTLDDADPQFASLPVLTQTVLHLVSPYLGKGHHVFCGRVYLWYKPWQSNRPTTLAKLSKTELVFLMPSDHHSPWRTAILCCSVVTDSWSLLGEQIWEDTSDHDQLSMLSWNGRSAQPKERGSTEASCSWYIQPLNELSGPQWSALHILFICAKDSLMVEENVLLPPWVFHGQQLHPTPGSLSSSWNQATHRTWLSSFSHWGPCPRSPATVQLSN